MAALPSHLRTCAALLQDELNDEQSLPALLNIVGRDVFLGLELRERLKAIFGFSLAWV
jgi:hypothetical protein